MLFITAHILVEISIDEAVHGSFLSNIDLFDHVGIRSRVEGAPRQLTARSSRLLEPVQVFVLAARTAQRAMLPSSDASRNDVATTRRSR